MPEHTMEALIMRVTPQANIIDRSGTTIPAKTAADARKILIQTARLQGGSVTVQQRGYDPSHPAAGNTLIIYSDLVESVIPNRRYSPRQGGCSLWSGGLIVTARPRPEHYEIDPGKT